MPLSSFGAILTFAETMEASDAGFYRKLAVVAVDKAPLFEQFAADGEKNVKTLQRVRRENVTEMILEPISDFFRAPYGIDPGDPSALDSGQALAASTVLEKRAVDFYQTASQKIRALPEVSRSLKRLGKKRKERLPMVS
ncbi:MAG: hypothetical protein PVH30_01765 [Desulfobacterales bacterium]|jgi:hypothetical protein